MLLDFDGSRHRWLLVERWFDLFVFLVVASSEIFYAPLVAVAFTAAVTVGLREVIERKALFCALYTDRGSHFCLTP